MDGNKTVEGFIPEGLVVSNLQGEAGGILTISGEVEKSEIKLKQLMISPSGKVSNGAVEAETVIINGRAKGVLFRASHVQVLEQAHLSDCIIEITEATGFSMHEKACFEGDLKLTTRKQSDLSSFQVEKLVESFSSGNMVTQIEHADIEADIPLGD